MKRKNGPGNDYWVLRRAGKHVDRRNISEKRNSDPRHSRCNARPSRSMDFNSRHSPGGEAIPRVVMRRVLENERPPESELRVPAESEMRSSVDIASSNVAELPVQCSKQVLPRNRDLVLLIASHCVDSKAHQMTARETSRAVEVSHKTKTFVWQMENGSIPARRWTAPSPSFSALSPLPSPAQLGNSTRPTCLVFRIEFSLWS